jgi:excisionase family DNA binding protein
MRDTKSTPPDPLTHPRGHDAELKAQHQPDLLDWEAAGQYLGTSGRHVKKLWSERRIPGIRVGRLVRFRPADLDAFIEAHRVSALR